MNSSKKLFSNFTSVVIAGANSDSLFWNSRTPQDASNEQTSLVSKFQLNELNISQFLV